MEIESIHWLALIPGCTVCLPCIQSICCWPQEPRPHHAPLIWTNIVPMIFMFWMLSLLIQQSWSCQRAQKQFQNSWKLSCFAGTLGQITQLDLTGVNQWPKIQHPWAFPGLYWDFHSSRSTSVQARTVEKQGFRLPLYLLRKLTTIEVSYLYNTLNWSGGKQKINHTAGLGCFSLSCSDAQIKPLINQTFNWQEPWLMLTYNMQIFA